MAEVNRPESACSDSGCAGVPVEMDSRPCPNVDDLWLKLRSGLHSFLQRRLRRQEDVEDVLQEVFLKIHRDRCSLADEEKVEAWVYRIARHAVTDFYRRQARRPEEELSEELAERFPDQEPSDIHETVLAWLEPMATLLPEKYRDALILSDFQGLPQQEVIGELQQSASALQSRADSYFDSILPGYRKSYELTRSMFRQGQADALEVWQVREKLLSSENEALDALAQAVNARGALDVELGGKIEEVR